jgi:predicted NAD/FAD-binding protein
MKLAIIGSGISGLVCAHLLHRDHEITMYEAGDHVGGHTNTIDVEHERGRLPVDTGFIVFNRRNYPLFTRLLDRLDVESRPSTMSFSVRSDADDFEYGGESLNGLFAQRRNLFRPTFYRMIGDILRFGREAPAAIENGFAAATLGEYLDRTGYGDEFVEHYLIPMGSAIWSCSAATVRGFPLQFFVRFFANHGMLGVRDRPQWRTVVGGSRTYVDKLIEPFRESIRLSTPVRRIHRTGIAVHLETEAGDQESFDQVIVACHSDQALSLLGDCTEVEREVLGAIPYQTNDTVLHTDPGVLPRRRRAWSSWNYRATAEPAQSTVVTYNMSILQGLSTDVPLCVSLNQTEAIDPSSVLRRFSYQHPVYSVGGVAAQQRHAEISGRNRTHFCGAYWGNGFHEAGVRSAVSVCSRFGATL